MYSRVVEKCVRTFWNNTLRVYVFILSRLAYFYPRTSRTPRWFVSRWQVFFMKSWKREQVKLMFLCRFQAFEDVNLGASLGLIWTALQLPKLPKLAVGGFTILAQLLRTFSFNALVGFASPFSSVISDVQSGDEKMQKLLRCNFSFKTLVIFSWMFSSPNV